MYVMYEKRKYLEDTRRGRRVEKKNKRRNGTAVIRYFKLL